MNNVHKYVHVLISIHLNEGHTHYIHANKYFKCMTVLLGFFFFAPLENSPYSVNYALMYIVLPQPFQSIIFMFLQTFGNNNMQILFESSISV